MIHTFTSEATGGGPYVGASFVYHLGSSEEANLLGQTLNISYSTFGLPDWQVLWRGFDKLRAREAGAILAMAMTGQK
jgi:hypothetical protein